MGIVVLRVETVIVGMISCTKEVEARGCQLSPGVCACTRLGAVSTCFLCRCLRISRCTFHASFTRRLLERYPRVPVHVLDGGLAVEVAGGSTVTSHSEIDGRGDDA